MSIATTTLRALRGAYPSDPVTIMLKLRGNPPRPRGAVMEPSVGQYLALHFKDVASAVEYVHQLVTHIIPRVGSAALDHASRAVVWFHVPRYGTRIIAGGCYLFMSPGALRAAQLAQLETPVSGVVPHSSLPGTSVLVFGEDNLEPAAAASAPSGASVAFPRFGASVGALARDVDYA